MYTYALVAAVILFLSVWVIVLFRDSKNYPVHKCVGCGEENNLVPPGADGKPRCSKPECSSLHHH